MDCRPAASKRARLVYASISATALVAWPVAVIICECLKDASYKPDSSIASAWLESDVAIRFIACMMYIYIYIHICMYVCMYTYVYIYIRWHTIYIYVHAGMQACRHACMQACMHVCMHVRMNEQMAGWRDGWMDGWTDAPRTTGLGGIYVT